METAEMWRASSLTTQWRPAQRERESPLRSLRTLISLWALLAAGAVCADVLQAPVQPAMRAQSRSAAAAIDRRVTVLAKALDLDSRQRAELWKILEDQRIAVKRIWSDTGLSAAERAPATRAAQERTATQIRSILSDEQRKRYNPPKPQDTQAEAPDVGVWMERQAARGGR